MTDITMRQLLEAGAHFGHQTRFWCPKMKPYIFGHRNKIHIINLERTLTMFNDAMNYLSGVASKRGVIMFIGTKNQASNIVREQSERAKSPYVYHRWLGGMLTNYTTVRKSIDRLNELEEMMSSESFSKISKKEAMRITREHFRLDRNLAGIRNMQGLPDALFVIDVRHEHNAVMEARKLGIPVVAVVDTNCDPEGVDYVIPGNDDAISAIRLFCTQAADAIIAGQVISETTPAFQTGKGASAKSDDRTPISITSARASVAPTREFDDDPGDEVQTQTEDSTAVASRDEDQSAEKSAETVAQTSDEITEPEAQETAIAESEETVAPESAEKQESDSVAETQTESDAKPESTQLDFQTE